MASATGTASSRYVVSIDFGTTYVSADTSTDDSANDFWDSGSLLSLSRIRRHQTT
jgi:hypothetical protein